MQRVLAFPPSRGLGDQREFVSKRMCFAFMFALGFLAFLGGFLLGRFVFDKELELSRLKFKEVFRNKEKVFGVVKNYSKFNVSSIIEGISESSIQQYLSLLTNQSKKNSALENLREAEILRNHLTSHGFDLVSPLAESQVQMAYPSARYPSDVQIVNEEGETVFKCEDSREKYTGSIGHMNTVTAEGSIVYVNFGRNEDYQYLDALEVTYNNKIFLVRAGEITAIDIIGNAMEHGAAGVLIFSDLEPEDVELPLVTPADLTNAEILYGNQTDKSAGTIPIIEIKSTDAEELFKKMSSQHVAPDSWKGKLKETYRIGPGFSNKRWTMKMKVSTIYVVETFYTTLGAMRGSQEPDRYVMLATEKDYVEDEAESTSIVMELVRVLGDLKAKGWRPHRSVVVAFWGVEGPNPHLTSHPENVLAQILRKTVTYFEIDSDDKRGGNLTLAAVTPMLEKLFYESALTVPVTNPSADLLPPLATENLFIRCGVPFIKMKEFSVKTLKDVATFWGVMSWRMIESYKLPFSLGSYAEFFAHSVDVIEKRFKTTAEEHSLLLDSLFQSVQKLITAIKSFEEHWSHADTSKSLEMRILSDQLLDFSRLLLCGSNSTPSRQSTGDFIFSKSLTGTDEQAGFGELQDLLQDIMTGKNSAELQNQVITHLANLVETINLTRETLGDGLEALVAANA